MTDYVALLKNIALNNNQDDIYSLIDVFLNFTEDFIRDFKNKGVWEEDLSQECALVVSRKLSDGFFLELNDRRERILNGERDAAEEIYRELIKEISSECESALKSLTRTEEEAYEAGNRILEKVNLVNDYALQFAEEYGMNPTPAELSEFCGLEESVIIEAVELSGYEIKNIDFETPVRKDMT